MSNQHIECEFLELKLASDDSETKEMKFTGYGAVFGNADSYGDVIRKGAFAATIERAKSSNRWPAMLLQHGMGFTTEDDMPIGVWTGMKEDDKGLKLDGLLADIQRSRDLYTLMKMQPRPAIDGLSIGYRVIKYEEGEAGGPRRYLTEIDLIEISPVTFPANKQARVTSIKSEGGLTIRDAEQALRDVGFSRQEAKAIVASGFKSLPGSRDAEGLDEIVAALRQTVEIIQS